MTENARRATRIVFASCAVWLVLSAWLLGHALGATEYARASRAARRAASLAQSALARGLASPVPLAAPAVARRASDDRVHVLGSGASRLVTAPVKDADDWDVIGVVAVPARPWARAALPVLLLAVGALAAAAAAARAVRAFAVRPGGAARVALVSATLALAIAAALALLRLAAVARASGSGLPAGRLDALALPFPDVGWTALLESVLTLAAAAAIAAAAWLASVRRRAARVRETLAAWGFLSPSLAHLLVFSVGPLLFAFYISLHRWDLLDRVKPFIGLGNYAELLADPAFWNALRNTAIYSLNVPVTMMLALGAAVVLDQRLRGIRLLRTIVFLPYVASFVAIAIVWQWMYNPDYGVIDAALRTLGLPAVDWLGDPRTALLAVMLVSVWVQLGYMMVIYLAGLQGIPESFYEAARLDGASAWRRFRHITVPLLRPVSVYLLVTGIIWSFQVFTLIYVMTEGGPLHHTDVLVYQIYQNAFEFRRMGYASAASWVLFALLLVVTLVQWRLLDRKVDHA